MDLWMVATTRLAITDIVQSGVHGSGTCTMWWFGHMHALAPSTVVACLILREGLVLTACVLGLPDPIRRSMVCPSYHPMDDILGSMIQEMTHPGDHPQTVRWRIHGSTTRGSWDRDYSTTSHTPLLRTVPYGVQYRVPCAVWCVYVLLGSTVPQSTIWVMTRGWYPDGSRILGLCFLLLWSPSLHPLHHIHHSTYNTVRCTVRCTVCCGVCVCVPSP